MRGNSFFFLSYTDLVQALDPYDQQRQNKTEGEQMQGTASEQGSEREVHYYVGFSPVSLQLQ